MRFLRAGLRSARSAAAPATPSAWPPLPLPGAPSRWAVVTCPRGGGVRGLGWAKWALGSRLAASSATHPAWPPPTQHATWAPAPLLQAAGGDQAFWTSLLPEAAEAHEVAKANARAPQILDQVGGWVEGGVGWPCAMNHACACGDVHGQARRSRSWTSWVGGWVVKAESAAGCFRADHLLLPIFLGGRPHPAALAVTSSRGAARPGARDVKVFLLPPPPPPLPPPCCSLG